jgi:transposase
MRVAIATIASIIIHLRYGILRRVQRKETRNTPKTCHRCGHVAQVKEREFRCPKFGLTYNMDLNACINIAHALMRGMG